jgi:hypothetical protein
MMRHLVTLDNKVLTLGSAGQQIAETSWPDHETALAYAERMRSFVGGELDLVGAR